MGQYIPQALIELDKIVADPVAYFPNTPKGIAEALGFVISDLSDQEYDDLIKSKIVLDAIEDNYDYADDTGCSSHLPIDVFVEYFT